MVCFLVSIRLPQPTTKAPGITKKAARWKELPPSPWPHRPNQVLNRDLQLPNHLRKERVGEKTRKKVVKGVDTRRRVDRARQGKADRNRRQCFRPIQLTIFHCSI